MIAVAFSYSTAATAIGPVVLTELSSFSVRL